MNINNIYELAVNFSDKKKLSNNFLKFLKRDYLKKSILLFFFIPADLILFFFTVLFFNKKISFAVFNINDSNFVQSLNKKKFNVLIFGSVINYLDVIKNKYLYFPVSLFYISITFGLFFNSFKIPIIFCSEKLFRLLLLFVKIENKYLILNSDTLPQSRFLIYALRKYVNIKIACLQHGILSSDYSTSSHDGSWSDINITMSKRDAKLIKTTSNITNQIYFNHPFLFLDKFTVKKKSISTTKIKVLLLGEGWNRLDPQLNNDYISFLKKVYSDFDFHDDFIVSFKPHPSASSSEKSQFDFIEKRNIFSCLLDYDVVVGFSSTALRFASMFRILTIQIPINGYYSKNIEFKPYKVAKVYNVLGYVIDLKNKNFFSTTRSHDDVKEKIKNDKRLMRHALRKLIYN